MAEGASSRRLALFLPTMEVGGAERVALELAKDFLRFGHEVDLVLLNATGDFLKLVPPAVKLFDLKARRVRSAILPLRRYLRERRPDALQALMWPLTVIATIAHRLAGSDARLVLSDHIALSKQYAELPPFEHWMLRTTIRFFYPRADARVVVSKGAADDLAALSGLDRASIEVVSNPLAPMAGDARLDPAVEARWGPRGGRILAVGNCTFRKNHALLIEALAKLRERRPAKLVIVGDGPMRLKLERFAGRCGLADHVQLPGSTVDPSPHYAAADLFVLSSDYEGFGNVLIEAMRFGLPVVSTDCPSGPSEILEEGRYGALVPVGDADALAQAMERMLGQPTEPVVLKRRADALSGEQSSRRYLELMLGGR